MLVFTFRRSQRLCLATCCICIRVFLFPCSHILSDPCLWYSGNRDSTSIAEIAFIFSIVSSVSLRVNTFFGCGFIFTILLGSAFMLSFPLEYCVIHILCSASHRIGGVLCMRFSLLTPPLVRLCPTRMYTS